ncbi:MAG: BREX-3 system P-loop-containing protein BrxF [Methanocorpusculum sp.]|nr:BREX-3 system P-loop-containing protein BrxF [Methanocorpusculum sp.]
MGTIIEFNRLPDDASVSTRLLVYMKALQRINEPVSVSKQLAVAISACKENRRSMKLEQIFSDVVSGFPDGVIIKDIDVMFNPKYEVDILKILISTRKRKRYSVIWPGKCENGKLIYGEEGYDDYKVFDVENYDITCVIGGYTR